MVGDLAPCEGSSLPGLPKSTPEHMLTEEDLREQRADLYAFVRPKLKELPFSEDVQSAAQKDAEQDFMSPPELWSENIDADYNLTRRIPVREERQDG